MTKRAVVFRGKIHTCYEQMYVLSGDDVDGAMMYDSFIGQANGLCGGAVRGGLFLRMGVHTGEVFISVGVCDMAPPVDDSWEEIVEASCCFNPPPITFQGWDGSGYFRLPLTEGDYRARFCVKGYGQSEKTRVFGDPLVENYCLLIWPAPRVADEILKQTSDIATYRHQAASKK
jgi:hypothetical protein